MLKYYEKYATIKRSMEDIKWQKGDKNGEKTKSNKIEGNR